MFKSLLLATTLVATTIGTANSSALFRADAVDTPTNITKVASKLTGQQQLKRLMRPHTFRYPVTRAAKAAAGNANMVLFDRRVGFSDVYRCSFITYRSNRAMVCD